MSNIPTSEAQQLPPADQLNQYGAEHSIPRNDSESDDDYAERMIYELDLTIEELWSVQDKIRDLVDANSDPAA